MKILNPKVLFAAFLMSNLLGLKSYANETVASPADYGSEAPIQQANRKIFIKPGAKWVNVKNGETVMFLIGEKNFTFHFQTYPNIQSFALKAIAPTDIDVDGIEVYVSSSDFDVG